MIGFDGKKNFFGDSLESGGFSFEEGVLLDPSYSEVGSMREVFDFLQDWAKAPRNFDFGVASAAEMDFTTGVHSYVWYHTFQNSPFVCVDGDRYHGIAVDMLLTLADSLNFKSVFAN